jgi:hypothetical protein
MMCDNDNYINKKCFSSQFSSLSQWLLFSSLHYPVLIVVVLRGGLSACRGAKAGELWRLRGGRRVSGLVTVLFEGEALAKLPLHLLIEVHGPLLPCLVVTAQLFTFFRSQRTACAIIFVENAILEKRFLRLFCN